MDMLLLKKWSSEDDSSEVKSCTYTLRLPVQEPPLEVDLRVDPKDINGPPPGSNDPYGLVKLVEDENRDAMISANTVIAPRLAELSAADVLPQDASSQFNTLFIQFYLLTLRICDRYTELITKRPKAFVSDAEFTLSYLYKQSNAVISSTASTFQNADRELSACEEAFIPAVKLFYKNFFVNFVRLVRDAETIETSICGMIDAAER